MDRGTKYPTRYLHADQIKTPTLFLGGEKDFNVPWRAASRVSGAAQPGLCLRKLIV